MFKHIMKREPHTITEAELLHFADNEEMLFAQSSYEAKSLFVTLKGQFRVTTRAKGQQYLGNDANMAVEVYNSIVEKYENPIKDFRI